MIAYFCVLREYYMKLLSWSIITINDELFVKRKEILFSIITEDVNYVKNMFFSRSFWVQDKVLFSP